MYGELMSRIGKQKIAIPDGTKVELQGSLLKVSGPKGDLSMNIHLMITVEIDTDAKMISLENKTPEKREAKQMHGTMRALVSNMVTGASKGFERKMEIYGTGYNLKEQGKKLVLQVGYCHPVELETPAGVKIAIETPATRGNEVPAKFTLSGPEKQILGQFAADIRKVRPPEPYKGKGIRYADEIVKRKVGKAFASGGA